MITNYIPNTCKYNVNNLKKVVHIFSETYNKVHIDNGEAYVTSGITDFQTISATSVSFNETTSYDDRFKFSKTLTVTVDGFVKLSALNDKYYVVIEDENGILWLINEDFPSLVTYTYTLEDGTDSTVFTFNALSNFPTLKLNAAIGNVIPCKEYSLSKVDSLKMLEKRYANIDASSSIIYGYSNQVYKTVKFNEGSLSVEEVFDGTNVNTTIQFSINMDDYQSSWHYNLLEYPNNKYVAVIDHLACGFEMGLVPSYNAQGSNIANAVDTVTITFVGSSQKGSEWANSWTETTVAPIYTWKLSEEYECQQTRWVDVEYVCDGYDKYLIQKEQMWDYTEDEWVDTNPLITASTLVERYSTGCGFTMRYMFTLNDSSIVAGDCEESDEITTADTHSIESAITSAVIGSCAYAIADYTFSGCTGLTDIVLPSTVTALGAYAFNDCSSLTSIDISNVSWLGTATFGGCSSLTSITITNLASLAEAAFYGCSSLTAITIPSVATISRSAYMECTSLVSVNIPSIVTAYGNYAFYGCSGLQSITINNPTPATINFAPLESKTMRVFDLTWCPIYVPAESVGRYKTATYWKRYADRYLPIPT